MWRGLKRFYEITVSFVCAIMDDYVGVYAAQASFFIVISVVPFLMLLLSLLNIFLPISSDMLETIILDSVPQSMQNTLLIMVSELFNRSASASLISVTAISTLWLSSRGILALYQGLNNVYHANIRNYFYCRVMSVFYTLIFLAVIILTIGAYSFGRVIQNWLWEYAPIVGEVFEFIMSARAIIFIALLTVVFALFYRFLVNRKPHLKFLRQLPGAFLAASCWIGFTYIYSIYIENFSNYSYVYGSLTAIIFLMLWLYFCMNIFLFGAQVNKMLETGYFKTLFSKK
ncbi:MAG: YihY/virulence factor BrkB family protein [Clostridia bacterium]|nr:YihY/virulence factor BrkB family protein [Clostridia bacterium]